MTYPGFGLENSDLSRSTLRVKALIRENSRLKAPRIYAETKRFGDEI